MQDGGGPMRDGGGGGGMRDGGGSPPGDAGSGGGDAGTTVTLGEGEVTGGGTDPYFFSTSNVSLSGSTIAIGAESANCEGGLVKTYAWDGTQWSQTQEIDDPLAGTNMLEEDCFGAAVALSGNTMIVGQPGNGGFDGAASVYTLSNGTWTQTGTLAGVAQATAFFGFAIQYDGGDAIVGAPWNQTSVHTYVGAVYVFDKKGMWSTSATIHPPLDLEFENFGASLSHSGTTLAVGAPGDFRTKYANTTNLGAVYSYTGSGSSWSLQASIQPNDGATTDGFGWSVGVNESAADGTILVVGSPYHTPSGLPAAAGAAYVYRYASNTASWVFQQKLTASDAVQNGNFGYAVAAPSSTTVYVGASGSSEVYEFTLSGSSTWTQSTVYTSCSQNIGSNLILSGEYLLTGKGSDLVIDTSVVHTGCVGP